MQGVKPVEYPPCIVKIEEHKAKLVLTLQCYPAPPLDVVEAYIASYPYLRFVLFYEAEDKSFRGQIEGRRGEVTKQTYREDAKKFATREEREEM